MIFRKNVGFCFSNPSLVFERRKNVVKDGFPSRSVKVEFKQVCLNSHSFLSSLPSYDCDKLEKDVETGIPLEQVSTLCMSPQSVDPLDLQKVEQDLQIKESSTTTTTTTTKDEN